MSHVRKGDLVVVISGANKGKRGKVLKVVGDRVVVEKVAMIKRHTRPSQKNPQGGIVDKEGTIHISNVQLFDDKTSKGTRTKIVAEPTTAAGHSARGGSKVRVGVKSGTKFPTAGM
jgi:large subunit ribosomal protein L24